MATPLLPLMSRAGAHGARLAVVTPQGSFTYADLLEASARVASALLAGRPDLAESRVALLVPAGWDYVAAQWGIWRAGGVAVPLAVSHPPAELEYVIADAQADTVVVHPDLAERVAGIAGLRILSPESTAPLSPLPGVAEGRRAMMVYTSGTTGRAKGVVTTHLNLRAQVESLVEAWGWTPKDRTLLVLPLHHVHGIVNVLTSALWAGAACEILTGFDPERVWDRFGSEEITLFMAVPTIYQRLIATWEAAPPERQRAGAAGCRKMRVMISGSAALPIRILSRWREITGHTLLERYGMTEIGMALSNPLVGERRPGCVGTPLPGVQVRLAHDGEIQVRGPGVFLEYWWRPEATRDAFQDGWFRTGDVAVVEEGSYRILGRLSVDIIKTGGYKVSALEIEEVLRTHPAVAECAVVGVEDEDLGERVCAAVELRRGARLTLEELRAWAEPKMAPYKAPRSLQCVEALPRNTMGKVVKAEVKTLFG